MGTQMAYGTPSFTDSIFGPSPSSHSSSTGLSLFSNNAFRRQASSMPQENPAAPPLSQALSVEDREKKEKNANKFHVEKEAKVEAEAEGNNQKKKKKKKKKLVFQKLSDSSVKDDLEPGVTINKLILEKKSETDGYRNRDESISASNQLDEGVLDKTFVSCRVTENSFSERRKTKVKKARISSDELEHGEDDEIKRLNNKKLRLEDDDSLMQDLHVKKQKINYMAQIVKEKKQSEAKLGNVGDKTGVPIHRKKSRSSVMIGTKRKKEETIEAQYEERIEGGEEDDNCLSIKEKVGFKTDEKKRNKVAENNKPENDAKTKQFDDDQKLKRTVFIGNLPLNVKKKALIKEFSKYGPVESARLRSIPLLDSKIPRKGAIIKGQINEAVNSQHAYIVFDQVSHANDALAHNMKEFYGNHIRVDAARAPHGTTNAKDPLSYDPTRSAFIGNLPFDVKDEELYQIFTPELNVEAIRVVRDPHTSLSKGIAFVLFKTKEAAVRILSSKRKTRLRDRILRITRVFQRKPTPNHNMKLETHSDEGDLPRKRSKLSASYEGIRSKKEDKAKRVQGDKLVKRTNRRAGKKSNGQKAAAKNRGIKKLRQMQRRIAESKS